jgi:hypothetical protein
LLAEAAEPAESGSLVGEAAADLDRFVRCNRSPWVVSEELDRVGGVAID